jgi:hypothetical protein
MRRVFSSVYVFVQSVARSVFVVVFLLSVGRRIRSRHIFSLMLDVMHFRSSEVVALIRA